MSSMNSNPDVLGDEYVYINMAEAYRQHVSTHVNGEIMARLEAEDERHYPKFKELGIPDERIAVISGVALRDVWRDTVVLDNLSPGDFSRG